MTIAFAIGIVGGALLMLAYIIGYRRAEAVCLDHQKKAIKAQLDSISKMLHYDALIAVERRRG